MGDTWTPTDIDRRPKWRAPDGDTVPPDGVGEFGARYNVHTPFIPFEARDFSPLERLRKIREFVDGLSDLKAAFTCSELVDAYDDIAAEQTYAGLDDMFYFVVGSRPLDREAHKNRYRYANPSYVHLHTVEPVTISDPDGTKELAKKFAQTGIHRTTDIHGYFDRKPVPLSRHLRTLFGRSYESVRRDGRRAMARTFATIREWEHSGGEIADAFGMPRSTVNDWIRKYALNDDFQVPDDPTSPHGYRYLEEYGEFRDQRTIDENAESGAQIESTKP